VWHGYFLYNHASLDWNRFFNVWSLRKLIYSLINWLLKDNILDWFSILTHEKFGVLSIEFKCMGLYIWLWVVTLVDYWLRECPNSMHTRGFHGWIQLLILITNIVGCMYLYIESRIIVIIFIYSFFISKEKLYLRYIRLSWSRRKIIRR
jgi:hypothetical protein